MSEKSSNQPNHLTRVAAGEGRSLLKLAILDSARLEAAERVEA